MVVVNRAGDRDGVDFALVPAEEPDRDPATTDLHRFPHGGDPLPRRARVEQRSGMVPAAQGRVRRLLKIRSGRSWRLSRSGSRRGAFRCTWYRRGRLPDLDRDIRFSKDKSPYKTHLGASLPVEGTDDGPGVGGRAGAHGNGGYFHFQPGEMYVGGGMWMAGEGWLDTFRRRVVEDPIGRGPAWQSRVRRRVRVGHGGETLSGCPPALPVDHPTADLFG